MRLTRSNQRLIEANESVTILKNRMIVREGKSEETLRRYLDGVEQFAKYMKASSPDEALKLFSEVEDRTMKLDGFVDWLLQRGAKPVNIKALFQGCKKWLTANRINGIDYNYISRPKVTSQIHDRIATTEELKLILDNKVSLRDKAFFLTSASSGLRIGTLSTLQIKDYTTIEELGKITVYGGEGRKLAKGKSYFTFLTPETRRILEEYLKTREPYSPEDPLFTKLNGESLSVFVQNISRQWRIMLRRAKLVNKIPGHNWIDLHPHTLRKFFQTRCKLAGCRSDFVDFWMGHTFVKQSEYLDNSYFRPNIKEHINEFRKAVAALSVFEDSNQLKLEKETEDLKAQVAKLTMELSELRDRDIARLARMIDLFETSKDGTNKKRDSK